MKTLNMPMDDTDYEILDKARTKLSETLKRELIWREFFIEASKMILDNKL